VRGETDSFLSLFLRRLKGEEESSHRHTQTHTRTDPFPYTPERREGGRKTWCLFCLPFSHFGNLPSFFLSFLPTFSSFLFSVASSTFHDGDDDGSEEDDGVESTSLPSLPPGANCLRRRRQHLARALSPVDEGRLREEGLHGRQPLLVGGEAGRGGGRGGGRGEAHHDSHEQNRDENDEKAPVVPTRSGQTCSCCS